MGIQLMYLNYLNFKLFHPNTLIRILTHHFPTKIGKHCYVEYRVCWSLIKVKKVFRQMLKS